jgi:hypothetical protein
MWRSLKNSRPHEGIRVKLKHMITGTGAPEREGWESTGIYKNGNWMIKQNETIKKELKPTHWDWIPK